MGQKALQKTFAISNFFREIDFLQSFFSHGTKSFAKNLCNLNFSVKLIYLQSFLSHGKKSFAKNQFHGKNLRLQRFFAKLFVPWGKKALQKISLTEKLRLQRKFLLIVYLKLSFVYIDEACQNLAENLPAQGNPTRFSAKF